MNKEEQLFYVSARVSMTVTYVDSDPTMMHHTQSADC